jgi:hypothetical protein
MNSLPRTSTARPPRPVVTMSPALTPSPRVATLLMPPRPIVTGPDASLTVHPAGPASAADDVVTLKIARMYLRIAYSPDTVQSGLRDRAWRRIVSIGFEAVVNIAFTIFDDANPLQMFECDLFAPVVRSV